jgi:hypothetical protein
MHFFCSYVGYTGYWIFFRIIVSLVRKFYEMPQSKTFSTQNYQDVSKIFLVFHVCISSDSTTA